MSCARTWIALGLLLSAPVLSAQNLAAQTVAQTASQPAAPTTPHRKSHKAQAQLVLPPLPSGPLSQLPMDQIPAVPAKVNYQDGLLSISAQNSSLGEILRDVRKLTGASIEIPQGSGVNERVVVHLGPGAPRDVLAGLLNGSSFNYVMLGSSSDPTAVSSVLLTPKSSAAGETQTAAANVNNANADESNSAPLPPGRVFPRPLPFNPQNIAGAQPGVGQPGGAGQPAAGADDSKDDDDKDDDDSADDKDQAQPDPNAQAQQPDPNQPNAGPKTPEQIMEMLRRQQPGAPGVPQPPQPPPQQ